MICSDLLVNYNIFIVPTMPDPLDPSEADAVEFFDKQLHEDGESEERRIEEERGEKHTEKPWPTWQELAAFA